MLMSLPACTCTAVRILLGRANVREKFTLIEANELISCGVEANGEILALRAVFDPPPTLPHPLFLPEPAQGTATGRARRWRRGGSLTGIGRRRRPRP